MPHGKQNNWVEESKACADEQRLISWGVSDVICGEIGRVHGVEFKGGGVHVECTSRDIKWIYSLN